MITPPEQTGALDTAACEALYRRLERPLYNLAWRWLWHPEDAREVVQETFVRLWRMRARVRIETVEPLVWRIAINLASNRRRAAKLRALVGLDRIAERRAPGAGADEMLLGRAETAAVRAAVDGLPEKLRRVVFLCAFSEMTYAEVAEALGISPGTVASRRNAAVAKLRTALGTEEAPDDTR